MHQAVLDMCAGRPQQAGRPAADRGRPGEPGAGSLCVALSSGSGCGAQVSRLYVVLSNGGGRGAQVSRNYLASLQQLVGDLEELGVEVVAVSADGRERAEAFVRRAATHAPAAVHVIRHFSVLQLCVFCLGMAA